MDYTVTEILKAMEKEDKTIKQSELILHQPLQKKIIVPGSIDKQPFNLDGHIVNEKEKWKDSEFLSEVYDEYLRLYQIATESAKEGKLIRSQVSNKVVTDISFNDWIAESIKNLEWRRDTDIPNQFAAKRINKQVKEFNLWVVAKSIEACRRYLRALPSQQIGMV